MKIFLLLFLLPLLPLWGQTPATVIHTEANLYQVDSLLYRSEQLVKADKEVILRTPIKTIINLRYFTRSKDRKVFSPADGITLINYPLLTWRITPKDIAQVLQRIRRAQQQGAVLIAAAKKEMLQGPYGYHSIWKNLEALFTEETVREVRELLK